MSTFDERRNVDETQPFSAYAIAVIEQHVATFEGEGFLGAFEMGSMRRYRSVLEEAHQPRIGDLDLLLTCRSDVVKDLKDPTLEFPSWLTVTPKKAHGWLTAETISDDERLWSLLKDADDLYDEPVGRMMIDAWWCPWTSVGPFAMFLTGPPEWNVWMRQQATAAGYMLSQYGLFVPESKPTKTYPNRVVAGVRVDRQPDGCGNILVAEMAFWEQYVQKCGLVDREGKPLGFIPPRDRDNWRREIEGCRQERRRDMRSAEISEV